MLCIILCLSFISILNAQTLERADWVDNNVEMDTTNKDIWWTYWTDKPCEWNDYLTFIGISPATGDSLWGWDLKRHPNENVTFLGGYYWHYALDTLGHPLKVKKYGIKIR